MGMPIMPKIFDATITDPLDLKSILIKKKDVALTPGVATEVKTQKNSAVDYGNSVRCRLR